MNIREIDPAAEQSLLDSVIDLRVQCWAPQTPVPLTRDDLVDPTDEIARHWVAIADGKLVGAARLSTHDSLDDMPDTACMLGVFTDPPPSPIGFLSRLVVAPAYRRRGLGSMLDEIRIRAAEQSGCRSLLGLVFEASGEARLSQLIALGFAVRGRGRKDTHPTFSSLPAPLVVERAMFPRNNGT